MAPLSKSDRFGRSPITASSCWPFSLPLLFFPRRCWSGRRCRRRPPLGGPRLARPRSTQRRRARDDDTPKGELCLFSLFSSAVLIVAHKHTHTFLRPFILLLTQTCTQWRLGQTVVVAIDIGRITARGGKSNKGWPSSTVEGDLLASSLNDCADSRRGENDTHCSIKRIPSKRPNQ